MDNVLVDELDQYLSDTFEDNIAVKYASYALPVDQQADPSEGRRIFKNYEKARFAYLRAIADLIKNQDITLG